MIIVQQLFLTVSQVVALQACYYFIRSYFIWELIAYFYWTDNELAHLQLLQLPLLLLPLYMLLPPADGDLPDSPFLLRKQEVFLLIDLFPFKAFLSFGLSGAETGDRLQLN
ncbi:MAG: hypothetical protein EZS28_015694 [Streblomastix strix]|uniref:Uncharacterized protein n=1 Tax=Streblomastix strix TaxID=222440 RepID=A0A5J4W2N6_9EUKA|nr:MAG: hypothetical protein EZS28_015694 [Streblomastix strix]